jgi:sarcosine oxidase/sarcosine oxidase subunit beta
MLPAAIAAGLQGRAATPVRVAIVGAGIAGLALAWVLARRGHRVEVHDAAELPNRHNASWDDGRIIRHAYGTMRGYARQMPLAFAAWRHLCAEVAVEGLVPVRALYALRVEGPWQAAVTEDLAASGFAAAVLDDAARRAVPMLRGERVLRVVEVGGSGLLRAAPIVEALLAWLRAQPSVTLHSFSQFTPDALAAIAADAVIVAAGAGTAHLLPETARAAGLWVGLHTVAYAEPPAHLRVAWDAGPILSCRLPDHATGGIYVLPPRMGAALKFGAYAVTPLPEADWADPAPPALDQRLARELVEAAHMALADFDGYRLLRARHCRAVMAPEEKFVLRGVDARTWMLSACSTHGFKLAPVNALAIAAMLEGRLDAETAARVIAGEDAP